MNVFVLNAGRSGSTTFTKACSHIANFTAAHESRAKVLGPGRLSYPENHIEVDVRLCWFLGRLDRIYGDDAIYVYLTRDRDLTAASHAKLDSGTMRAYQSDIVRDLPKGTDRLDIAYDYLDTVDGLIELFLKDKSNTMRFRLEDAPTQFPLFWRKIGARGDLQAGLREFGTYHNNLQEIQAKVASQPRPGLPEIVLRKGLRVAKKLPRFLRDA